MQHLATLAWDLPLARHKPHLYILASYLSGNTYNLNKLRKSIHEWMMTRSFQCHTVQQGGISQCQILRCSTKWQVDRKESRVGDGFLSETLKVTRYLGVLHAPFLKWQGTWSQRMQERRYARVLDHLVNAGTGGLVDLHFHWKQQRKF